MLYKRVNKLTSVSYQWIVWLFNLSQFSTGACTKQWASVDRTYDNTEKFFCAAPAERPSPPLNLNYSDQIQTAITLTWETPASNGGSMITGYIIEKCDEGSDKWLRCNARLCPDLFYRVYISYTDMMSSRPQLIPLFISRVIFYLSPMCVIEFLSFRFLDWSPVRSTCTEFVPRTLLVFQIQLSS